MKTFFATWMSIVTIALSFTPVSAQPALTSDQLIKGSGSAVFWLANDGRRYVFPNAETFYTWFSPYDFTRVRYIGDEELRAIPLGGNVTYRPGSRLIKVTTDPRVYAVDRYGTIHWIESESLARALYGSNWTRYIDDVPDAFFVNYSAGAPITRAGDFSPALTLTPSDNIAPRR